MDKYFYMVFDARAMEDIDDAICLYATDSLKDAKSMQKEFGACVIAKSKSKDKDSPIILMPETFYNGED